MLLYRHPHDGVAKHRLKKLKVEDAKQRFPYCRCYDSPTAAATNANQLLATTSVLHWSSSYPWWVSEWMHQTKFTMFSPRHHQRKSLSNKSFIRRRKNRLCLLSLSDDLDAKKQPSPRLTWRYIGLLQWYYYQHVRITMKKANRWHRTRNPCRVPLLVEMGRDGARCVVLWLYLFD